MRRPSLALAFVILLPALACQVQRLPLSHHETRSFPAEGGKLVAIDARSLDVDVRVVPGDTIDVTVDLEARSSSRGAAGRWLQRSKPEFENSASRLAIRVPSGRSGVFMIGYFHSRGSIRVALPPTCRLEAHTASGDVELDGAETLAETVRIETASGDLSVRGGVRELVVDTASGDVRVTGDELERLQAGTASGDIELRAGARRVQVNTASGDLRLERLRGELSVHTASGSVRATWKELPGGTRVLVETASGDVALRIPDDATLGGRLHTSSGKVRCDFPGRFESRQRSFALSGAVGAAESPPSGAGEAPGAGTAARGGASEVEVKTSSGDVTLSRS